MFSNLNWILILCFIISLGNCLTEPINHDYCVVGAGAAGNI